MADSINIYDALKGGAKVEDLVDGFIKDLNAAQEKIAMEKRSAEAKADKDAEIDDARDNFIDAYVDYIDAIVGFNSEEDEETEWDHMYDILIKIEKILRKFR